MKPGPAGRLSRVLVGWHPRRWRERYGEEMLDVLDQHRASTRTVLNLAAKRSATDTSRRRRRHREMFAFSAVRTTHATGAGCLLTMRQDAQARAKASSTSSCAVSRSPTLTRTVNRQSSLDLR
jgi:hypothetical protein